MAQPPIKQNVQFKNGKVADTPQAASAVTGKPPYQPYYQDPPAIPQVVTANLNHPA